MRESAAHLIIITPTFLYNCHARDNIGETTFVEEFGGFIATYSKHEMKLIADCKSESELSDLLEELCDY